MTTTNLSTEGSGYGSSGYGDEDGSRYVDDEGDDAYDEGNRSRYGHGYGDYDGSGYGYGYGSGNYGSGAGAGDGYGIER